MFSRVVTTLVLMIILIETEGCDKAYNVTRIWNTLRSPNYPSKFPPQVECTWRLVAYGTYRVKLQFTQFALVEPSDPGMCSYQWLKITDDSGENARIHYQCGRRSPGTIVSRGKTLMLSLHSDPSSSKHDYQGFEASYSVTKESPIFPVDTNKHKPLETDREEEEEEPNAPKPTERNTLGDVLDRLRPRKPSSFAGKTQSELIEEFNRRRNQGIDAPENPLFRPNGNPIGQLGNQERMSTSTLLSTLQTIRTRPRRRSSLSYELEMVLIIIGVLAGCFLLLFIFNKLRLWKRIKRLAKNDPEVVETKIQKKDETVATVAGDCFEKNEISTNNSNNNKRKKHCHRHTCKKHRHEIADENNKSNEEESSKTEKSSSIPKQHKYNNIPKTHEEDSSGTSNQNESPESIRPNIRKKMKSSKTRSQNSKTQTKNGFHHSQKMKTQDRPKCREPKKKRPEKRYHYSSSSNSTNSDAS